MHRTGSRRRVRTGVGAVLVTPLLAAAVVTAAPAQARPTTPLRWSTVVNNGDVVPGTSVLFNSYNQPSVNLTGLVAFRARSKGPSEPVRGVFTRNALLTRAPIRTVADTTSLVPQPNNLAATYNEFPSFPRIDRLGPTVATRGQSTPVWQYALADGTDTRLGTSGVYATIRGTLTTAASLVGSVPGFEQFAVPGAAAGTRFDQFPGAPAVDGRTIVFKGNYTVSGSSRTGVFFRDLGRATNPVRLIASSSTRIPNQPSGGTTTFGSTAPPSAAAGRTVFVGLDDEQAPTLGGIYLAATTSTPTLRTLVGIGSRVPGTATGRFTGFGEGLSFDGRYVAFAGSWGTATRTITLQCPNEGNADLRAYCLAQYGSAGFTTSVPVNEGIFVNDTRTGITRRAASTATQFSGFRYWVYSGRPPGTGGGDEPTLEPPRWRASAFVAVSGGLGGYQVAFKADTTSGATGIYLTQRSGRPAVALVDTTMPGTSIDPEAPSGSKVSAVGLERDGLRGPWLAVTASMLDPVTSAAFAGVYFARVPALLGR